MKPNLALIGGEPSRKNEKECYGKRISKHNKKSLWKIGFLRKEKMIFAKLFKAELS